MRKIGKRKALDQLLKKNPEPHSIKALRQAILAHAVLRLNGDYSEAALQVYRVTKIKLDHETIRRFAENEHTRHRDLDFDSGGKTRRALADYLLKIGELNLAELLESTPLISQFPARLADFFRTSNLEIAREYAGIYECLPSNRREDQPLVELTLSAASRAILSVKGYLFKNRDERQRWHLNLSDAPPPASVCGWTVFADNDLLLMVLQNERARSPIMYISAARPVRYTGTRRIRLFFVSQHTSHFLIYRNDVSGQLEDLSLSRIGLNILTFQCISDFSCSTEKDMRTMEKSGSSLLQSERQRQKDAATRERLRKTRFKAPKVKYETEELERKKAGMGESLADDNEYEALGDALIWASFILDDERVREIVSGKKALVNYREQSSGCTAIFFFAAYERWETVQFLLDTGECDLLIRDIEGRLLSTVIAMETENMAWCKKVMMMEVEQGRAKGIVPTRFGDVPINPPDVEP